MAEEYTMQSGELLSKKIKTNILSTTEVNYYLLKLNWRSADNICCSLKFEINCEQLEKLIINECVDKKN